MPLHDARELSTRVDEALRPLITPLGYGARRILAAPRITNYWRSRMGDFYTPQRAPGSRPPFLTSESETRPGRPARLLRAAFR